MNIERLKEVINEWTNERDALGNLLIKGYVDIDKLAAAIVGAGHWIPYCECDEHDGCSNDTSIKTTHEMVCVHCGSSRRGIIHGEPKPTEAK